MNVCLKCPWEPVTRIVWQLEALSQGAAGRRDLTPSYAKQSSKEVKRYLFPASDVWAGAESFMLPLPRWQF